MNNDETLDLSAPAPEAAPAPDAEASATSPDAAPAAPKRRGRPRKNPAPAPEGEDAAPAAPKRRGRPRKNPAPAPEELPREEEDEPKMPRVSLPAALFSTTSPNGTEYSPRPRDPAPETPPSPPPAPAATPLSMDAPPELPPVISRAASFTSTPSAPTTAFPRNEIPSRSSFGGGYSRNTSRFGGNNDRSARFGGNNNGSRHFGSAQNNPRFDRNNNRGPNAPRDNDRSRYPSPRPSFAVDNPRTPQNAAARAAETAERAKLAKQLDLADLRAMPAADLDALATHFGVNRPAAKGLELVFEIVRANNRCGGATTASGIVEVLPREGHALLRSAANQFQPSPDDVYISSSLVRSARLRTGDSVSGELRPPRDKDRYIAFSRIASVNGRDPAEPAAATPFENLRAVYPDERLVLETEGNPDPAMRMLDLFTPVGKGQRALVLVPPRADATPVLAGIATALAANNPETLRSYLLLEACPEDVTEITRTVKADVYATALDDSPDRTAQLADMVIEIAKRQVEAGKDAVVFVDSLTRLSRAFSFSGGDPAPGKPARPLPPPGPGYGIQRVKRLFGAARNIEGGGSLTIIATAATEGSHTDQILLGELFSAANMTLHLDALPAPGLPPLDLAQSGTRRADLLMHADELARINALRRDFDGKPPADAVTALAARLSATTNNLSFLLSLPS